MSRNTSNAFKAAAFAQETGEAFLPLLTISHATLPVPYRFVANTVNIVSRGNVYTATPINVVLPDESDDNAPRARLSVDNVGRTVTAALRSIDTPLAVLIEIVLASAPDVVEASWPDFELRQITYDALVVEGDLTLDGLVGEPYPSGIFSPGAFPGLF